MNKNIDLIIQARTKSKRLPKKVLADIEGKPMILHIINRLKHVKMASNIILAIAENDKELESLAVKNNINYFVGSEDDVLLRYLQAAKKFKSDIIIRITGDNPLVDPELIDYSIKKYLESGVDYLSTKIVPSFPEGLRIEIFNFNTLELINRLAENNYEREHVTPYIYQNPDKFKIASVENNEDLSYMRWTVDEEADLNFVREIYKKLYKKDGIIFLTRDVVNFLKMNLRLLKINKKVVENKMDRNFLSTVQFKIKITDEKY